MKQVIRRGLKEIIVDEVPDPVVTPHHVLIRPFYSVISAGTETAAIHSGGVLKEVAENPSHLAQLWNVMKQVGVARTVAEVRAKFEEYAVLGYSGAGVVIEKHPTVGDLEVGDRVAYGGEGTGHGETVLAGRNLVARVPSRVAFEHACFTTLGSIAMNAVRIAGLNLGDVVAVVGLGLVGQLVSQLVRVQGGVVVAVDIKPSRVELARQTGADHALLGNDVTPQQVLALTGGRGADCVIVAAASRSPMPVQHAIQMSRDRGRIVVVGAVPLDLPREAMYKKELQLLMARAYGPGSYDPEYEACGRDYPLPYVRWTENRNMEEFLRLVDAGRVQLGPLISHEFPLEEAARGYEAILSPGANSLAVLLRYPAVVAAAATEAARFTPVRKLPTGRPAAQGQETLRLALVGAGNIAKWEHLPNLKRLPGVALHAVCSTSGPRAKSYALRFGAAYNCTDYAEMLRDPAVDVVLIASRHQHHCEQALAALAAGKHVFLEKPMAITSEECRKLLRAAAASDRSLTVGFNRRFAPCYVEMKKLLARRSGPAIVNCRVNSPGLSGSYWAADPSIGGALIGEGCHFIDLLYWLLGSEPVTVAACSLPLGGRDPIGENNVTASFRFADGSIANLTYCTVGSRTSGGERVEAFASGIAVLAADMKKLTVQGTTQKSRSSWLAEKGHRAQMQAFLGDLRQGRQPEVTARDGARATLGGLLVLEAARTGAVQAFDLDALLSEG